MIIPQMKIKKSLKKEKEEKEKEIVLISYKIDSLMQKYGIIAYELQYDLLYEKYLEKN